MAGTVKAEVEIWTTVQRFIKVEGGRKGRGWGEDAEPGQQRMIKGKTKGDQCEGGEEEAEELSGELGPSAPDVPQNSTESGEIVQVVKKIDSINSVTGKYILFSAVGSVFGRFVCLGFLGY
jgi:hypothetical protein